MIPLLSCALPAVCALMTIYQQDTLLTTILKAVPLVSCLVRVSLGQSLGGAGYQGRVRSWLPRVINVCVGGCRVS